MLLTSTNLSVLRHRILLYLKKSMLLLFSLTGENSYNAIFCEECVLVFYLGPGLAVTVEISFNMFIR